MASAEDIDKAIGAHETWKNRFNSAIELGETEIPIETIRTDNQCEFGKWLYGKTISSKDKSTTYYKSVRLLHSAFHRTAAHVAELAINGKKDDAEKMIASDGEYNLISSKLIQVLTEWKLESK
jgi:hypothetical protein